MTPITKLIRILPMAQREELNRHLRERRLTFNELRQWLATQGFRVSYTAVRRYAIAEGIRQVSPRTLLRIDRMLSPEDRAAYETLLANPRTSVAEARAWLRDRGYSASAPTVSAHRRRFLTKLDGVRETARLAASIAEIAREHGDVAMSNGMLTRFEQVMLEQFMLAREGGQIPAKDLADMSKSVAAAVGSREQFEAMRREFEETKVKATEAAEHAAKGGATGRQVVERVREILGMPPLPAPDPGRNA